MTYKSYFDLISSLNQFKDLKKLEQILAKNLTANPEYSGGEVKK